MDAISVEALDGLAAALAALLPPATDPDLAPTITVQPRRIVPTGLGGFVGLSTDPEGDILGRRLEASALITVRAEDAEGLGPALSSVTRAMLAADRGTLRSQGLLRLDLESMAPQVEAPGGGASRELGFTVLYEYLKRPEAAGDLIRHIPIDIELDRGTPMQTVIETVLGAGSLALFEVVDDAAATTAAPSDWQENAAEARIEQRSAIRGGTAAATPNKPGTALVLRTAADRPPVRDFILRTTLASGGGGVGLVFRFLDPDNFYFFLMDAQTGFRLIAKKAGGTFQALDTPARDATQGYEPGRLYDVKLTAEGDAFAVHLDGRRILEGRDPTHDAAGRVGFFCRNNGQGFFYRIALIGF